MKRSEYLVTLSWEHHDGLVVAFRLHKGLKVEADLQIMHDYIMHVWNEDLSHHFWQEEQILSGPLSDTAAGREQLARMDEDHKFLQSTIERLKKESENKELIGQFADRLSRHIRFEERQLFPFVEENLTQDQLAHIRTFLHKQHRKSDKCWQQTFWK